METKILKIEVKTPMHVGSGQDLGIVDMPIQRERPTQYPKIEGSSLKGAIRHALMDKELVDLRRIEELNNKNNKNDKDEKELEKLKKLYESKESKEKFLSLVNKYMGNEGDDSRASAISLSDARLLLFPVKSVKGVFAYITCPKVLNRLNEDMLILKRTDKLKNDVLDNLSVESGECVVFSNKNVINGNVILEEYCFKTKKKELDDLCCLFTKLNINKNESTNSQDAKDNTDILDRVVILNDDDFCNFVQLSTEVITRNKIKVATGTATDGALFSEEFLPAESILYSLVFIDNSYISQKEINNNSEVKRVNDCDSVLDFLSKIVGYVQIGGDATIGKGITKVSLLDIK